VALPIVHAAAGYLIQRQDRALGRGLWPCAVAVLVANLPDFDFLVGFAVGEPGLYHRGFSHTVLAALLFGAVAGILYRMLTGASWLRGAVVFACIYGSHLLVDALTVDARAPHGAQFLWPLTDAYLVAPVAIFGEILVDGSGRAAFLRSIFNAEALAVLASEAAISAAAVGAWLFAERVLKGEGSRAEPVGAPVGEPGLAYAQVEVDRRGRRARGRVTEGP